MLDTLQEQCCYAHGGSGLPGLHCKHTSGHVISDKVGGGSDVNLLVAKHVLWPWCGRPRQHQRPTGTVIWFFAHHLQHSW